MRNNYYSKSYKEKTNPFPHEFGRRERPRIDAPTSARDEIKENENINYTQYIPKNEIESVWGYMASDTEEEIYAAIDHSIGNTEDISPALLDALKYYEQTDISHEKKEIQNNKFKTKNNDTKSKIKPNHTHKIKKRQNNQKEIEKYRF